jgi:hypothetical protein
MPTAAGFGQIRAHHVGPYFGSPCPAQARKSRILVARFKQMLNRFMALLAVSAFMCQMGASVSRISFLVNIGYRNLSQLRQDVDFERTKPSPGLAIPLQLSFPAFRMRRGQSLLADADCGQLRVFDANAP